MTRPVDAAVEYLNLDKVRRAEREWLRQSLRSRAAADELGRRVAVFLRAHAVMAGQAAQSLDSCSCECCVARREVIAALTNYLRTA